ncbi:hypothetical protein BC941DRAFT_477527 [Chlamydoabsidia padenii]|nr:hypothetical protein BC941DRAFT_477527 [Chlamydoabsidia padenii]
MAEDPLKYVARFNDAFRSTGLADSAAFGSILVKSMQANSDLVKQIKATNASTVEASRPEINVGYINSILPPLHLDSRADRKRKDHDALDNRRNEDEAGSSRARTSSSGDKKFKQEDRSSSGKKEDICRDCNGKWISGHRCAAYIQTKKAQLKYSARAASIKNQTSKQDRKGKAKAITDEEFHQQVSEMNITDNERDELASDSDYISGLATAYDGPPPFSFHDNEHLDIPKPDDSLAGTVAMQKLFLEEISNSMKYNQSINKRSFCTVPESIVHLHTPPGKTCFRRQYAIPDKLMPVVDEAVKTWFAEGTIVRARINNEWNSPLTLAPKKNADGTKSKKRPCLDPRHINALLPDDRYPLPLIKVNNHYQSSVICPFEVLTSLSVRFLTIIYDNPSADNHADHRKEPAQTTNDDPRDDESSDEDEVYATDAGSFDCTRPAHYKFATPTKSLTDSEQLSLELFQLVKSHGIGRDAHDALVKLMNSLFDKVFRNGE